MSRPAKSIRNVFCIAFAISIQGCGGGGSATAPSAPVVAPVPPVAQPVVTLPKWVVTLKARNTQPAVMTIGGFGSSVGAGATLTDPNQAPVMYFGSRLAALFPAPTVTVSSDNRSVNGSIVSQFINDVPIGNWNSYLNEGKKPTVVLLAYGMNDGFPAMYNAAQPPPFFYSQLVSAIKMIQAAGAEPIIMTTPHPKSTAGWSMPAGISQTYPTAIAAPVASDQMTPSAANSVLMQDPLSTGILIPVSQRHLEINKQMRQAATDTGATLIDVESYWFKAVATKGESALFNSGETVHPNLLGHQLSYQKAIDDFLAKISMQVN